MITKMLEKLRSVYPKCENIKIEVSFNQKPDNTITCDYLVHIRGEQIETFESLGELNSFINRVVYKIEDNPTVTEKYVESACLGDSPPSDDPSEPGQALSFKAKEDCEICHGKGVMYIQTGEDGFDRDVCVCVDAEVANEEA